MNLAAVRPDHAPRASAVSPETLHRWLASGVDDGGRTVVTLDTRNDFEVGHGRFQGAVHWQLAKFSDFPAALQARRAELHGKTVVSYCTGGIRCEKAGPFMELEGFRHVFQLEGGILKYFEECGSAHYDGECFVFDQRVGVDPRLNETDSTVCLGCQSPLSKADQADPRYLAGASCPFCFRTPAEAMADRIRRRQLAMEQACNPLPGSVPYDNFRPINVPQECDGAPLLEALSRVVRHIPSAVWAAQCDRGLVLNQAQEAVPATRIVRAGERYLHKFPDLTEPDVNGKVEILHEDEALIVLNKPAPLPMHPSGRYNRNTLQYLLNAVYYPQKPHPAHRLDANTTGLVLVARTRHFAGLIQPQFERDEVEKVYLVRVLGQPASGLFACDARISDEPGVAGAREVDTDLGRSARTEFKVLRRESDGTTLIEARPLTGRTNQIRVHLWHLGLPVCGDPVYLPEGLRGGTQTLRLGEPPLCLHAWRLKFLHPLDRRPLEFTAPPPAWVN